MDHEPYDGYYHRFRTINTEVLHFTDTIKVTSEDNTQLTFMFGNSGTGKIWIDNVSLIELNDEFTGTDDFEEKNIKTASLINYPNPFNNSAKINFEIIKEGKTEILIFDSLGRKVKKIFDEYLNEGRHQISWNADNLASGIYFISLKTNAQTITRKCIVLK